MIKTIEQCANKNISVRYQCLKPLISVKKNLVLHKTIEQYKNKNSGITYQYLKPLNTV